MNSYDCICVFGPKTKEEKTNAILLKLEKIIKDGGGEVVKVEKWGLRRLPFRFKKAKNEQEGFYTLTNFKGSPKTVPELQSLIRVTEDIIRFIITKAVEKELPAAEAPEKVEIAESMLSREPKKEER
ncbi:MAG: 30S ribosomal protein S6 [Candidatus Saganbacteria bacterium]|nr:30S ribosomal protein S6 [Candidatus Saganbacteria bacterium]